ncbi:MAG TPA: SMP-30/gluconolactonase/LRE family protein, partial [Polyangiaceae bacterium]|nr:SMP-30/gluconolactonase/LRE family protein [Polyangiaceae bacterium]
MSIPHTIRNAVRLSGTSALHGAALVFCVASAAALLAACRAPEAVSAEAAPEPSVKADVGAPTLKVPPAAPRALPDFCQGASAVPLPRPAQVQLVKDGFVFVEGPVWSDKAGAFFFSEMDFNSPGPHGPPSKIHQLVLPSTVSLFIPSSGSNGLAIDAQGLVACTHDTQTLSRYDLTTRQRSVLVSDVQSKHFNSPNDVALHSAGYIYFTDPDWQLPPRQSETGITGVYFRNPAGEVRLVE